MSEALTSLTAACPEEPPDTLYEVIDGRVVEKPLKGAFEPGIVSRLTALMHGSGVVSDLGQVVVEMLFKLPSRREPEAASRSGFCLL